MSSPPARTLLERRLHLFTGKGGVGKTSLAAAMALALAQRGKRPLLVELGHRASIESILVGGAVGYSPREVAAGVWAMNMELDASLAEYIGDHLRVPALGRYALRSASLRRFFEAAPGVAEVAVLHKLRKLLDASDVAGSFDPILVDLDATGHARMFFELPGVFAEIADAGPIRALLDGISAILRDPDRTALHLVTLPAELPAQETIELYRDLCASGPVRLGSLIVNRMPAPVTVDVVVEEPIADGVAYADDLRLVARAARSRRRAEAQVERLRAAIDLPSTLLPAHAAGLDSVHTLTELGDALLAGWEHAS